jgi:type IV pilus assembly protein PilV
MTMTVSTLSAEAKSVRIAHSQGGFSLIEALIAFVVLTVGILGIISLLIMSKNALHQSGQRTLAVSLANEMVENIRINPTAIATYNLGASPLGNASRSAPGKNCTTDSCSPIELAAYDLWAWEQALDGEGVMVDGKNAGGLIAPQACITFTAQNGLLRSGMLNVVIQWRGLSETFDAVDATGGVACGGADAGDDPYRRQVTVNTIVLDESEF